MEYALANQMIASNPCIVIEIPWSVPKAEEEIALTQEEQNDILSYMEDNWYKELFYFMCLSGVRVGEVMQEQRTGCRKKCPVRFYMSGVGNDVFDGETGFHITCNIEFYRIDSLVTTFP